MARRRPALAALATLVLGASGATVAAQPTDEAGAAQDAPPVQDPAVAKKWLGAGQAAFKKGSWEPAVVSFENALAAGADINTYYELALAEEKLGRLDRAATHLRIVTTANTGVRPDVRKKALARFDALTMKVGLVSLTVTPTGATIATAGARIATAPMIEPVILMPGTYTLSFSADGYQPKDVELKIEAGSETERAVELAPIEVIVRPPPDEPAPAPALPPAARPARLPLYIGGGVTLGAVGVGVVTGLLATARHGTFTDPASTATEREDARTSGKNLALITDITLGVGVAAAAFTAYWYFHKYLPSLRTSSGVGRERTDEARAKVDVVPWVQAEAGGLTVAGSF